MQGIYVFFLLQSSCYDNQFSITQPANISTPSELGVCSFRDMIGMSMDNVKDTHQWAILFVWINAKPSPKAAVTLIFLLSIHSSFEWYIVLDLS